MSPINFEIFEDIDDDLDVEDEEQVPLTKEEIQIAQELKQLFNELINNEDALEEEFISGKTLTTHFNKHCLAGSNITSSKTKFSSFNFNLLLSIFAISKTSLINKVK